MPAALAKPIVFIGFYRFASSVLHELLAWNPSLADEIGVVDFNPQVKEEYEYMRQYCPYTNVTTKAYPTMLVKTGINDSQVMYWEPAKWVAKLRAMKTDKNPLLLVTNMGAGHGGASGRYDRLKEIAFDYAYALSQVGITK